MIPVNVEKISYHTSSRSYAVLLKENDSDLVLPILVGSFEAQSIALALEVVAAPRPLTHDLICDMALRLNAQIYVTPEIIKEAGVNQKDINESIKPKYSIKDLESKLKKAVEKEEYEKAAKIRDKIKELDS